MNQQHEWAEDDFDLPDGVVPLGLSEPVSGKTYVMYHGTTKSNAQTIQATGFRQSTGGMLGRGVYLSRDLQKASRYPIGHPESDRVVIKVSVNVGKVKAIRRQGDPLQKTWHDHGYDTAWVPPKCGMVTSGLEEDCVWDPSRIKIITTIRPRPIQSPRPVQSSSSWNALSYNDHALLYPHAYYPDRCCPPYYNPWMHPCSDSGINWSQRLQWTENDNDLPDEPVTGKKTVKSRGTAKKKQTGADLSFEGLQLGRSEPVTGAKTAKGRGTTKKMQAGADLSFEGLQLGRSEPVTGAKTAKGRGTTKKMQK